MAERKGAAKGSAKKSAPKRAAPKRAAPKRAAPKRAAPKRAAPKRAAKAAPGAAKPGNRAAADSGAVKPEPAAPNGPANGARGPGPDWAQLADRAAAKWSELVKKARPYVDKARPYVDKARPAAEKAGEAGRKIAVDLSGGAEKAFEKVSEQAKDLVAKGQHGRVRIKFRGKQLVELPVAVVAAAEVAGWAAFGPLQLLIGNVVGKAVLDVEFISNADTHVADGRTLLADGEFEKALAEFDRALAMDRRCAGAYLGRGIALKLRGDKPSARAAFEKAEEFDPHGEAGREARRHLDNLGA